MEKLRFTGGAEEEGECKHMNISIIKVIKAFHCFNQIINNQIDKTDYVD